MEKLKNLFELKDQKWPGDVPIKKKLLNIFGNFKSSSWRPNLNFEVFDKTLAKYLIYKEFFECIGYISSYLPKAE